MKQPPSSSPSLVPTNQIQRSPHLQQRIIRRLHALDPRDRIKDDLLLLRLLVAQDTIDLQLAQLHDRIRIRPVDGRVIRHVALDRHLRQQFKPDRAPGDARCQLGLQILGVLRGHGVGGERGHARGGHDVVADERRVARGIDQLERRDAPVLLGAVALGGGLGPLHVHEGLGVGGEEGLDGRRVRGVRGRRGERAQHGEELGAGARGEGRRGVADHVGVLAAAGAGREVEADGDAAGVGVGVGVGDVGDAGGVGEAHGDGGGGRVEVLGAGEGGGLGAGCEFPAEQGAFGVRWGWLVSEVWIGGLSSDLAVCRRAFQRLLGVGLPGRPPSSSTAHHLGKAWLEIVVGDLEHLPIVDDLLTDTSSPNLIYISPHD
jgi:hypothetical protein